MADRRSFPRWPRYSVTPSLIETFEMAMKAQGVTRTELARRVGLTQGGITRLLNGEQASSARIPAICEALGLPTPDVPLPDEVLDLVRQLDDGDRKIAVTFLRRLVRQEK